MSKWRFLFKRLHNPPTRDNIWAYAQLASQHKSFLMSIPNYKPYRVHDWRRVATNFENTSRSASLQSHHNTHSTYSKVRQITRVRQRDKGLEVSVYLHLQIIQSYFKMAATCNMEQSDIKSLLTIIIAEVSSTFTNSSRREMKLGGNARGKVT